MEDNGVRILYFHLTARRLLLFVGHLLHPDALRALHRLVATGIVDSQSLPLIDVLAPVAASVLELSSNPELMQELRDFANAFPTPSET